MPNHMSNEELKEVMPQFPAWWASKTEEEKAWYIRFWRYCSSLPDPRKGR